MFLVYLAALWPGGLTQVLHPAVQLLACRSAQLQGGIVWKPDLQEGRAGGGGKGGLAGPASPSGPGRERARLVGEQPTSMACSRFLSLISMRREPVIAKTSSVSPCVPSVVATLRAREGERAGRRDENMLQRFGGGERGMTRRGGGKGHLQRMCSGCGSVAAGVASCCWVACGKRQRGLYKLSLKGAPPLCFSHARANAELS
jgi:hypothetical protein